MATSISDSNLSRITNANRLPYRRTEKEIVWLSTGLLFQACLLDVHSFWNILRYDMWCQSETNASSWMCNCDWDTLTK